MKIALRERCCGVSRECHRESRDPRPRCAGGRLCSHQASNASAGAWPHTNAGNVGTPNRSAATNPTIAPAVGSSQKNRYGTALFADHDGLSNERFIVLS
jgi:hypothetical protein